MKQDKKVSKHIKLSLWLTIIIVAVILLTGFYLIPVYPAAGYLLCLGGFFYLIVAVIHYEYFEKLVTNEFLAAGFEQSQIQKRKPGFYPGSNRKGY